MSSDIAIRVEGLGKRYRVGATTGIARYRTLREDLSGIVTKTLHRQREKETRDFWALKDVSFEVKRGETVGIIGRNGAGKSTLLKILARITPPSTGRGGTLGRVGSLLEVGTGLHPELTGRENIWLAGAVMGMKRPEVSAKFDDIVEFSGLEHFLDTPLKRYSSGMGMRLGFSVAAHLEPDILLVDEVLAVGDSEFQKKCLGRMGELSGAGRTVLFVSHSMPSVLRLCPRVILLDGGHLTADGSGPHVVEEYMGRGHGGAERKWPEMATAPGDDRVKLRSVRIINEHGEPMTEVDIRKPVFIEVTYWDCSGDSSFEPIPSLSFINAEGTLLFVTHANDTANRQLPNSKSLVSARCRVPGNFFAEGGISVSAAIVSYRPPYVHVSELDIAAFHVMDHSDGDGVRRAYVGDWPGAVRPMLEWELAAEPLT